MKKWKIIIFVLILLFSIYKVIDSKNLDIKDNVYIVSQSDVHEKESISNNISDENDNQEKEKIKIENINIAKEPLYTTKPNLERSGMGFTIMESFMDSIEVQSIVGLGTKIIMTKTIGQREEKDEEEFEMLTKD